MRTKRPFWTKLFTLDHKKSPQSSRQYSRRLGAESLEGREMMTATQLAFYPVPPAVALVPVMAPAAHVAAVTNVAVGIAPTAPAGQLSHATESVAAVTSAMAVAERTQFRITALRYHVGEAENPVVIDKLKITDSKWITASSWEAAVLKAVSGKVVTSAGQRATFSNGFAIGNVSDFAGQSGNELLEQGLSMGTHVIILQGAGNADNNGNYWVVSVSEREVTAR